MELVTWRFLYPIEPILSHSGSSIVRSMLLVQLEKREQLYFINRNINFFYEEDLIFL
jgi:hypothetical protein